MRETGATVEAMRADGGASVMDLLLQLQADQIRVPVTRPVTTETTALGVATMAGLAEGVWSSLDELAGLWRPDVEYRPTTGEAEAASAYSGWCRAVERSLGWAAPF
jgi:glycerol kinase